MQERRPTIDVKAPKAQPAAAGEGGGTSSTKRGPIYVHRPKVGAAGPTDETQETTVSYVSGAARAPARRKVLLRILVRELPAHVVILAAGVIGLVALLVTTLNSEGRDAALPAAPLSQPVTEAQKPTVERPAPAIALSPPATPRSVQPSNQAGATATVAGTAGTAQVPSEFDNMLCEATAAYQNKEYNVAATLFSKLMNSPNTQLARSAKFLVDFLEHQKANRGAP